MSLPTGIFSATTRPEPEPEVPAAAEQGGHAQADDTPAESKASKARKKSRPLGERK